MRGKMYAALLVAFGVVVGCAGGHQLGSNSGSSTGSGSGTTTTSVVLQNHAIPGGALTPLKVVQVAENEGWHIIPKAYAQTTTQPDIVMSFDGFCAAVNTYVDYSGTISANIAESGNLVYGLGSLNNQSGKCYAAVSNTLAPGQGAPVAGAGTLSTFRAYANGGGNAAISIFINGVYQGSPCTLVTGQNIGTCDASATYSVNDGDYVETTITPPTLTDVQGLANIHILFGKS